MKTLLIRSFAFLAVFAILAPPPSLYAQPQNADWNVAILDQILAGVQRGQTLVRVGDMEILAANLKEWRNHLAGEPSKLSAFSGTAPTWPDGDVYYTFTTSGTNAVPDNLQKAFLDAAGEWATFADLHFVPWTTQANYVTIEVSNGLEGGESAVGMVGGQQFLSVGPGAWNRGTLCHEIGHTLGLVHEHQRSDRDSYVSVLTNNIVAGGIGNFVLLGDSLNQGTYDFLSVMHYSRNYLSGPEPSGFDSTNSSTLDTIVTLPAYTNYIDLMGEPGPVVLSDGDRAGMAAIYGTTTLISSVVTNTQDSGPGSLRAALYYAFDNPGTHVTFDIATNDPGYTNGVFTIQPTDQLPWLVNATFLDGASQPTNAESNTNGPSILINGALAPRPDTYANGLLLGGSNCTVQSLVINGFAAYGILITNATGNTVAGCYLAIDPSGTIAVSNGLPAVNISAGTNGHTIGNTIGGATAAARNVISGSSYQGMVILGAGATGNFVEGNYIGLNAAGTTTLPNAWEGIEIAGGARDNYIGGTSPSLRNIISGNGLQGVLISDASTTGNVVEGNFIGLNPSGNAAMPNSVGVNIISNAQGNLIGGVAPGAGNVISGNAFQGVSLQDPGTTGNLVQGNWIGINAAGTAAIPNLGAGVGIYAPVQSNIIGGTLPGMRNIISGNGEQGVAIGYAGATGNIVEGNYIGLNPSGEAAIPNTWSGVNIYGGAQGNLIGGTVPGAANLISGNSIQGISFQDSGTSGNLVEGNWIGLDATGAAAIPNAASGVEIFSGAQANIIGGTAPGAGNVISGNAGDGVLMDESGTSSNLVAGNWIGLDASGTGAISNADCGVEMLAGAEANFIGGIGGRNFISGNAAVGVLIDDGAFANVVQGNTIGLNAANSAAVPNIDAGVGMFGGVTSNLIGGTTPGAANLIADNLGGGIALYDETTSNNVLRANSIFGNTSVGIGDFTGANQSASEFAPALASAVVTINTTVSGTLTSLPNTTFHLDFYASPPPANQAQASTYLGTVDVITGAGGNAGFTNSLTSPVPIGQIITGTATDPAGNTTSLSAGVTVTGTDSVGDGITDAWRSEYFGGSGATTNSFSCATCDPDHDGFDNLQEFLAGTNPTNAASKLLIGSISENGADIRVNFFSVQGIVYRIEFTDNLAGAGWSILADQIIGTGGTIQLTDPNAARLPQRYYRVAVLP